ncbi:glycosyltransferase [Paenibacillus sp. ISL-20]|uniref:glycosyltransferase n=1 Tax=Paenibacillus sp. ISL-20 TaxID=2819163 RepID=UPI001BEB7A0B|nr:glycosyltransferase [Paenibacillus sp. ISL-20]
MRKILVVGPKRSASYQIILLPPLRYLEGQGYCRFEILPHKQVTRSIISSYDIILFLRSIEPAALQCLEWARLEGKKTVYVIDDHFLAIPQTSPLGQKYSKPAYKETYIYFLKNAHMVKVESPVFCELIKKQFNPKVIYFPGGIDISFAPSFRDPKKEDRLVIGYEGAKKESSFRPVIPALKRILKEYGDFVRLEFYGYCPEELKGHPNISHREHNEDYSQFMKKLYRANWDIGLAPMDDNLFYRCKSNVKFRDYASCRIPGIYSLSPVYRDCVFHKETGYVVPQTEQGWYNGIREMIENPKLRIKISQKAAKAVTKNFSVKQCAENWRSLFQGLIDVP